MVKISKDGDIQSKKFTCPLCSSNCGLLIDVKDNVVQSIKVDKGHPLTKGYCCPKGLSLGDVAYDKDRVLRPV